MDELEFSGMVDAFDAMYTVMCKEASGAHHATIFAQLASVAAAIEPCEKAIFWKWDKLRKQLWTLAEGGVRREIPDDRGMIGRAVQTQHAVITDDLYHEDVFDQEVDEQSLCGTRSMLVMPVYGLRGTFIGVFQLLNRYSEDGFFSPEADCKRLSAAALLAGTLLESEQIAEDVRHDPLTHLKNRNGFYNDYSKKYFRQMLGTNSTRALSLFLCEIDGIARCQEDIREDVLRHTAHLLTENRRENDDAYDWGNGRFVMMLSDTALEGCVQAAERMRRLLEERPCQIDRGVIRMKMSFGCIGYDSAVSMEENLSRADELLKAAQQAGGNQVKS